jgi:hypothetical protein
MAVAAVVVSRWIYGMVFRADRRFGDYSLLTTLLHSSTTHHSVVLPATTDRPRMGVLPFEGGKEKSRRRLVPKNKTYTCPLCDSALTRDRYLQIVGVWEERKRLETSLKRRVSTSLRPVVMEFSEYFHLC